MSNITVYLKAERNTEMQTPEVFLKDIARIRCRDPHVEAKVKAIKVHSFSAKKEKPSKGRLKMHCFYSRAWISRSMSNSRWRKACSKSV